MKLLTISFLITLAILLGSAGMSESDDSCLQKPTDEELVIQKTDRLVSMRTSDTNLRVGPGVRFCVKRKLGREYHKKTVRNIGKYDTWRIISLDGETGWVHRAMLSSKLYDQ